MRKNWKLIAYGMTVTAVLSMTACAADEKPESPSLIEVEIQETDITPASPAEEETEEFFLEDYYKLPDGKAAIEADFKDLAGEGMSVTISVIMDSIDVVVKYEDSTLLTEDIKETLAQQLESMTDRFWRWTIAYDEVITYRCVLTVRYIDPDGNILAEQSYSAE